jgi:hypothetical protein
MIEQATGASQEGDMRKYERRHLVFYLRVFDGMSSRVIGHIADISQQGLMLISDDPVPVNENYRLRLRLPAEIGETGEIIINGTSRWCKPDVNPDFYVTGFQLYDLSDNLQKYLLKLVDEFSFNIPK